MQEFFRIKINAEIETHNRMSINKIKTIKKQKSLAMLKDEFGSKQ
jgi:hypothetical protein